HPDALDPVRLPGLHRVAGGRPPGARAAPARGGLLQPHARRPQAGLVAGDELPRRPPSPLELLGDRRAVVDTGLGPIAFVVANALFGLHTAAYVAVGLAVLVMIERLIRRRPVTNAIGGVLGTGLAVFIALRSGHASGYFVPRMLYAAALAL